MDTYNWLCIAILATEWHVKWKCLAVADMCVTCFWATESVDSTVEWLWCFHIYQYFSVCTLEWYIVTYTVWVAWWISYCFISHRLTVNTGWWDSWHSNHWWLACRCSGHTWLTCDRNSCLICDRVRREGKKKEQNQSMISPVTCDIERLSRSLNYLLEQPDSRYTADDSPESKSGNGDGVVKVSIPSGNVLWSRW